MRRNKLYSVNKWNRPAFMPKGNLFAFGDGLNTTTFGYSLSPLESYLPKGLSEDTYRKLAIGTAGQMQNAFQNYGKSVVDSFGKGPLVQTPTSGPSLSNTDPSTFFNLGSGNSGGSQSVTIKPSTGQALGMAASAIGSIPTGERRGMWDTLDPVHHLAGGRESGVGNALGDTGVALTQAGMQSGNPWMMAAGAGLKIVGGLTNAAFGIKTDQKKLEGVNAGIKANSNFVSNADSFDDVKGPESVLTDTNVYQGGWFSGGKAAKKNEDLKQQMIAARSWANRSVDNNIFNLQEDQLNDALANYSAYGGPLASPYGGALGLMQQNRYFDTIDKRSEAIAGKSQNMQTGFTGGAKTFDAGGLKSTFLDEFGSDPIGAAVRYNRGLEALAAQEEARKIEAAREAEYLGLQQRMANLETENQGLQALMAAQQAPTPVVPEIPESSSTPSLATPVSSGNSTWDYIENQLRNSGKFNDVQIQGIKYNLQRESGIGKYDNGDNGTARGLAQWRGDRIPKDMSLEGQTRHLIDTLSNYDGKLHWIGEDNYRGFMNARTPEEAHYYIAKGYERPHKDIVAKVKRDSDMSLRNLNAFGGELGTNGTDFTSGLLYIDEGGSHESNPLDGVPMGLDPQGIPNLVEEGETVYNDYVFSDRMKVPFFMYKELGLGGAMKKKGKGMSFADASKKLAQESEQRPNDPISQAGLDASLSRLAEVQETERMRKQGKEYMGLERYACGGKIGNKYEGNNKNGQKMKIGASVPSIGFNMPVLPSIDSLYAISALPSYGGSSSNHRYGADASTGATATTPDTKKKSTLDLQDLVEQMGRPSILQDPTKIPINPKDINIKDSEYLPGGSKYVPETNPKTYATWMRYAPAVGSGIMTLTDMLGLTNRPDYTYAGKLEAAANAAGYVPNVKYDPIGDYLRYDPMDIWFEQNALNAQARATDRAISNNSSPSKMAGLIANGYNSQLASGELYKKALEYNDAKRERVADFNRRTNMFNSQMGLEAAMANARYHQAAQQMGLSGLAQAAALRDSIDARVGAAKSANITNFLTSLGNIGRENFALNQINTDRSRNYTTTASGKQGYKRKKS